MRVNDTSTPASAAMIPHIGIIIAAYVVIAASKVQRVKAAMQASER
jgi:hypothetical protein